MASIDIFQNSVFTTRELSEAIDDIPNMYGRIGEMGLFEDKSIQTPQFQIESQNGVLQLVNSQPRGVPQQGMLGRKREMRDFSTRHFPLRGQITADDIIGIRAYGSESELMLVADKVNEKLTDFRSSLDITREYLRAGALRGQVLDADGTVIVDLFSSFGVTQKTVAFSLGSADPGAGAREGLNHITRNLKGDMMTGVHALCSEGFFDALMQNDDFKEAYKFYMAGVQPLREDVRGGIFWQGITWEQYLGEADVPQEDGSSVTRKFIPDDECVIFPVGTRQTFRMFNAPADYMETVNTPGQPFYAKQEVGEMNKFINIEAQTNPLPLSMRPAVLIRGTA